MAAGRILAVDPGKDKCGLALLDHREGALWHGVAPTTALPDTVAAKLAEYSCRIVVLGDQTYSAAVRCLLQPLLTAGQIAEIATVDERGSTAAARARYWEMHPPDGWRRFLPRGLLVPPCAIDDVAAIILGERYFAQTGC